MPRGRRPRPGGAPTEPPARHLPARAPGSGRRSTGRRWRLRAAEMRSRGARPKRTVAPVRIAFQKPDVGERYAVWVADRGKRRVVRGGAGWAHNHRLPHDLAGYAVERALGLEAGVWHLL